MLTDRDKIILNSVGKLVQGWLAQIKGEEKSARYGDGPELVVRPPSVTNVVEPAQIVNQIPETPVIVNLDAALIANSINRFTEAVEKQNEMFVSLLKVLTERKEPTVNVQPATLRPEIKVEPQVMNQPPVRQVKFSHDKDGTITGATITSLG